MTSTQIKNVKAEGVDKMEDSYDERTKRTWWLHLLYLALSVKALIIIKPILYPPPDVSGVQPHQINMDLIYDENNNTMTILDRQHVSFTLTPRGMCVPGDLVFLVLSATRNSDNRNMQRKQLISQDWPSCMVFLLGKTSNEEDQEALEKEHALHHDILQITVEDSYNTLSYKTLGGFIWTNREAREAKLIIKIDDDVRLDVNVLMEKLNKKHPRMKVPPMIECPSVIRNMRPWRHNHKQTVMGKWSVSRSEMPRRVHADFCNGWIYTTTPEVALALAQVGKEFAEEFRGMIRIDDVLVTGLLRERLPWVKLEQFHSGFFDTAWNKIFSTCPLLGMGKNILANDVVLSKGSGSISYIKSGHYIFCAIHEYFIMENLEYFFPNLVPEYLWNICSR